MPEKYEWAGPNADVAKVLDKYCYGTSKPPFALMLDGTWGCGKTWFIKRFFEEKKKDRASDNEPDMIYVSLYGIQDAEEITKAIYTAMHPILGGKVGELGKVVFKGLLKSTLKIDLHHLNKVDLSFTLGLPDYNRKIDIFSKRDKKKNTFQNRILVFDDVERAKMPVSDILALIQPLVESYEDRVILVANEKEIASGNETERNRYKCIKEKTVYLTVTLTPDAESSWKAILTRLPKGPFHKFLNERTEDFCSFIRETKQENLRILHFFINFGKDVFQSFNTKENQEDDNVVFDILCLLYGLLIEKNIRGRTSFEITNILTDPFKSNKETYKETYDSNYFSILKTYYSLWKIVYDLIESGTLHLEDFKNNLSYFIRNQTTPIWKRLSTFQFETPSKEHYTKLIKEFRSHLQTQTAENDAELLHVCNVYLMLKNMNIDGFNTKDSDILLKEYIKKYCESLLSKEIDSLNQNAIPNGMDPAFWGFLEENAKKIKKINDIIAHRKNKYIPEKIVKIYEEKLDENQLLEALKFFSEDHPFAGDIPFIHKIDPDNLLANIDKLPTGLEQHRFFQKLYHRFQNTKRKLDNSKTLEATKPLWKADEEWFEKFIEKLQKKADGASTHPLMRRLIEIHIKTLREG